MPFIKKDEQGLYVEVSGIVARPVHGGFSHGFSMDDGELVEGDRITAHRLGHTDIIQLSNGWEWGEDRRNWRIQQPNAMRCERCDGEGVVSAPHPSQPDKRCPVCYGSGVAPAKNVAKMTLEDMDKKQPAEPRGANWGAWG
jgi:hypothetical protein